MVSKAGPLPGSSLDSNGTERQEKEVSSQKVQALGDLRGLMECGLDTCDRNPSSPPLLGFFSLPEISQFTFYREITASGRY